MKAITVRPDLLLRYAQMNRNAIALHMALKAEAVDGALKRNVSRASRLLGKPRHRILEAEYHLKRRRLLRVSWVHNGSDAQRWWHVYDQPCGVEEAIRLPAVLDSPPQAACDGKKSLWRRVRDAIVGTELTDLSLTERQP